jgi:hypothetical protein
MIISIKLISLYKKLEKEIKGGGGFGNLLPNFLTLNLTHPKYKSYFPFCHHLRIFIKLICLCVCLNIIVLLNCFSQLSFVQWKAIHKI